MRQEANGETAAAVGENARSQTGGRGGGAAGKARPGGGGAVRPGTKRTLSQRLMGALTGEIRALERALKGGGKPSEADDADGAAGALPPGAKARVDAIGALTRTLEKLLDLARFEATAARHDREDENEAERLRAELMKRLRAIDARRAGGRRLFGGEIGAGGPFALGGAT